MKKLGIIFLSIVFMSSIGCATSKTGASRKSQLSGFDESELEQIRTERMLMFNLQHI